MENFENKIKQALEVIESGKKLRLIGDKHKFYAYSIISNDNGKEYITYSYKDLSDGSYTWGCCDVDFDQLTLIIEKVYRNEPFEVTVKD